MADHRPVMQIDHAVFTSTATRMAQGYRIVASSAGLTSDEKKHITTASPSHSAMAAVNDDNVGLAFYPLKTGRYCIARSTHAGLEQTARGGQRVLTHCFALTADQLNTFDNNPFACLRALQAAGVMEFDELPKGQLACVSLPAATDRKHGNVMGSVSATAALVATAFADDTLIAANAPDIATTLEMAILFLPKPLRLEYSFTIGLKFAMARRYRMHAIGEADIATKRIVRGQPIQLIENFGENTPNLPDAPWVDLWFDAENTGKLNALLDVANEDFDSIEDHTLSEVAAYQRAINHIDDEPLEALLAAWQATEEDELPESHIERNMLARYITTKKDQTVTKLKKTDAMALRPYWSHLLRVADCDDRIRQSCEEVAARCEELHCPWLEQDSETEATAATHA